MRHIMQNFLRQALIVLFCLVGLLVAPKVALATVSITPATGGTSISADSTSGSYTTLTGPTITEGANKDITTGTIIINAPSGFEFNTGATVTGTITQDAGSKTCFTFTSTTATPAATTITFTVNAIDGTGGNPVTTCHVTFSNIQVRPTAGTPLASGSMTKTGTETGIPDASALGTLTEVVGAKTQLAVTTQPSSTASPDVDFTVKPVVTLQDQFGNTVTTDSASTVTTAVVLSSQTCGGTAGSGTLTSTPASGQPVVSGVMTYTAMQYSAIESIKICFSSSGVTSALSNTINVANTTAPAATTDSASSFIPTTANLFGNITNTGGETGAGTDYGFAYSTDINLSTGVSTTSLGTYSGTGSFSTTIIGLDANLTYYYRAYAQNSVDYGFGDIKSFATGNATPARKMRLFEGFTIRLIEGRIILYQQ